VVAGGFAGGVAGCVAAGLTVFVAVLIVPSSRPNMKNKPKITAKAAMPPSIQVV
jgi:hypothetical protein